MSARDKQVGGDHYQKAIQPWDIIDSYGLNYYEGNALKYLLRRKGDRAEDLRKAIHYLEKELEDVEGRRRVDSDPPPELGNEPGYRRLKGYEFVAENDEWWCPKSDGRNGTWNSALNYRIGKPAGPTVIWRRRVTDDACAGSFLRPPLGSCSED